MKLNEVTEVTIDDYQFYLRRMPAMTAANLSGELTSVVAPIISAIVPLLGQDKSLKDVDVTTALPLVSGAFSSLTGNKVESLVRKLLLDDELIAVSGEATDGKAKRLDEDLMNEVFAGEIQNIYILCWNVIRLNFGGFFKSLAILYGNQED